MLRQEGLVRRRAVVTRDDSEKITAGVWINQAPAVIFVLQSEMTANRSHSEQAPMSPHNPLESQRAKGGGLGSSDNLHDGSSNSEPYCRVGKTLAALIVHGNHLAFGHYVICIT